MKELREEILARLQSLPGEIGFYYKNLVTGEEIRLHADQSFQAASVIKLYIMAEALRQCRSGRIHAGDIHKVSRSECVPSCGALTYMHDGLEVTIQDLYTLMIILSDNSATNILIDILGFDRINDCISFLGHTGTALNRKMYDEEKSARGIQNYVCPKELGDLLERLYLGQFPDEESSTHMLSVMEDQRLNAKIPFYIHVLPDRVRIAHKTGEDDGITHDVGIVYAKQPFIVVFLGNETSVPEYERTMAELSLMLFYHCNGDYKLSKEETL